LKRALQFAGALVAALLLHLVGTRLVPEWPLAVDLMLLVVVFNALDGRTFSGLMGGLLAGWVTDALTGQAFGLFGLVDTIIGYSAAFAVQRIVIQRPAGAALLFSLAAACQQGLVLGLSLLLLSAPEIPAYPWLLVKAAVTGVLGGLVFFARQRVLSSVDLWRHTRQTRIRLER
jgi:rod shape-determining protein MreD